MTELTAEHRRATKHDREAESETARSETTDAKIEQDYEQAFDEWQESPDSVLWDQASGDGLEVVLTSAATGSA